MIVQHAIYGSESGLGDYQILGASPRFDDKLRATFGYHANLEWSALTAPFAPIFSFFSVAPNLWAFTRTLYLSPSTRGNDYLVHAIVLDPTALAQIEYQPFLLAGGFASQKPKQKALAPLDVTPWAYARPAPSQPDSVVASSLRTLAKGPLRLRIDTDDSSAIVREIHESLPPVDRLRTAFCTRLSYGRNLEFRLAAFVTEDEARLRAMTTDATIVTWPPSAAATPDLFDRWAADVRGQADLDLFGPSILRDAHEAFVLLDGIRKLRLWTSGGRSSGKDAAVPDLMALATPAAVVLRPENRRRPSVQPLLPGALAVDLCNHVRSAQTFDESARLSSDMQVGVRRDAVQWIRQLPATPTEAWMAELLLLLPDEPLEPIANAVKRTDLFSQNANAYRSFLTTTLAAVRDRFGSAGASAMAAVTGDLPPEARLSFSRVMEETAARDTDRARQTAWFLAIARANAVPPAVGARIALSNDLLPSLDDDELAALAPAFFAMEEKLAQALKSIVEGSALDRALANVLQQRLKQGWMPRTPFAIDVLRRILSGASTGRIERTTAVHLTMAAFLAATLLPNDVRSELRAALATVIERLAAQKLTAAQAALLLRALQRVGGIRAKRSTLISLFNAARKRKPTTIWNSLRHLRLTAIREAIA